MYRAAVEQAECVCEFVALIVVDQIAALDHQLRSQCPDRVDGAVQDLRGERLLRPERRLDRRPEPRQEGNARGRGSIHHVRIGEVGKARQLSGDP